MHRCSLSSKNARWKLQLRRWRFCRKSSTSQTACSIWKPSARVSTASVREEVRTNRRSQEAGQRSSEAEASRLRRGKAHYRHSRRQGQHGGSIADHRIHPSRAVAENRRTCWREYFLATVGGMQLERCVVGGREMRAGDMHSERLPTSRLSTRHQ